MIDRIRKHLKGVKVCPFCKRDKIMSRYGFDEYVDWDVFCQSCGCSVPANYDNDTENGAIEKWNNRK